MIRHPMVGRISAMEIVGFLPDSFETLPPAKEPNASQGVSSRLSVRFESL
jgi:hypothetical protein